MKREISLSDIVIIGIVITTILAVLKVFEIVPYWWIVPIPVFGALISVVVYLIIAILDEFRY